jgi:ribosomal protein S18 acetylase RimI-like enzyme
LNNPITARAMSRDDLKAVSAILDRTELFPSEMLSEMAEPYLVGREPHIWLVAESDGSVFGFAYCEPERMTDGTYNLLAIAVDPDRQNRGIGQHLVASVEQATKVSGGRVLLVETSSLPEYERTRSFYDQLGFDREAVIREFYAKGEDKVIFLKQI